VLLTTLQEHLSELYETPVEHRVMDFLVTDARIAQALAASETPATNSERLLLRQSEESLEVTLYIDDDVLNALTSRDPYTRLDRGNLNDFLIALEGVSHFHYLVWNAAHARQVTQLEMELQAEVDKFVTASMLLHAQGGGEEGDFHDSLFSDVVFHADDAIAAQRYREANHYAGKYCRHLARRFPAQHREPSFINELRRFYRLPRNEKIRCIERTLA
jgi:hypothetical protein